MSTIKDNIRRIAETEELRRLIAELLNEGEVGDKASIDGIRYYATETSGGGVSSFGGGTPTDDVGTFDNQTQYSTSAQSANGGDNLGDSGEGVSNGAFEKDIQDVFDSGLSVGDKVKGLTGLEDCSSGATGEIRTDGQFVPPSIYNLTDYTPQDWLDGNDPREANWQSGVYYTFTVLTLHKATNPYAAAEAGLAEYDSNDPGNAPHTLVSIEDWDPDTLLDGQTIEATFNRTSGTFTANVIIKKTGCTVGVDAWCPSTAPVSDWTEDSSHQLAFDGAQFKTFAYEASGDQNPNWVNDPSKLSACTSGGDNMSFQAGNNGQLLVNIDSGADAGTTYVIKDSVVVDVVADKTPYLPSAT